MKAVEWMDENIESYIRLEPREDYDPCVVGVARRFNVTTLCYGIEKILAMHMAQGMTRREAEEYFEFNTAGAWLGEETPVFIAFNEDLDFSGELN